MRRGRIFLSGQLTSMPGLKLPPADLKLPGSPEMSVKSD